MSDDGALKINEMMQAAQRMQQEIQRIQQELAQQVVEGSAGGGMVVARANGRHQLIAISIDPTLADPKETGILQDLIVAAVNQALGKAAELAQEALSRAAGGLPIKVPGLF